MAQNLDLSRKLQQRAEQLIPGGVNSPVRAFRAVGGEPPFLVRGEGACVYDADGNSLHRLCRLLGTSHCLATRRPKSSKRSPSAARKGTSFGASTPAEIDLAEAGHRGLPVHREAALRQLRHRSHHVGHPAGARRHRAQIHHQVRRLLSRPQRCAAGEGRLRRGHARHSRLGRGAGRVCPVHPGSALQRSQGGRSRPSTNSRGRSPASSWSRWSATWAAFRRSRATWNFCGR